MTNDNSASIVSKVWNYAHVLKNAGVGYGDYVEQITYLLLAPTFGLRADAHPCGLPVSPRLRGTRLLKLADEMTELGFDNPIPAEFQWSELSSKSCDELEVHYRHTLENLGTEPGLVGILLTPSFLSVGLAPGLPGRLSRFARLRKARNKISNPSDLA